GKRAVFQCATGKRCLSGQKIQGIPVEWLARFLVWQMADILQYNQLSILNPFFHPIHHPSRMYPVSGAPDKAFLCMP
ncbi:MAG TPA: hypothetical protein PKZ62_08855, partial [Thermoclostridium caenicola]|nr:hypothetical protein [Thermoclostridium caenicola]